MMHEQNPYADILTLPHHKAENRPQMSMHDRAAQFSPFAALTGFDGVIAETGRRTDRKIELSESQMTLLDQKMALIDDAIQDGTHPVVTMVYFVPDAKKEGGSYQEYTGKVRHIDAAERKLVFLAENDRSTDYSSTRISVPSLNTNTSLSGNTVICSAVRMKSCSSK